MNTFNFISNFIIVNKKFMELLSKNYKNKYRLLESFSSIILGGQCMIRKDGNNDFWHYITYYEEDKKNKVNFYLKINDIEQIKIHLNLILNHNLWFYLELINFNYQDQRKDIYDEKGKEIGYFVNNCEIERAEFLYDKKNKYINQNYQEYQKFKLKSNNKINIEKIPKLLSILACLSLINEFKNNLIIYSQHNQNVKLLYDFFAIFWKNDYYPLFKQIDGIIFEKKNFEVIIKSLSKLINEKLDIEKDNLSKDFQFDEENGKINFMNKHKKASLIQKIFFCPQEKIVHCPCSLTSYAFNYKKYFSIDLNKENNSVLLSKKIFER